MTAQAESAKAGKVASDNMVEKLESQLRTLCNRTTQNDNRSPPEVREELMKGRIASSYNEQDSVRMNRDLSSVFTMLESRGDTTLKMHRPMTGHQDLGSDSNTGTK